MQLDELPPDAQTRLREPLTRSVGLAEAFLRTSRAEMLDTARFEALDFAGLTHQAIDDAFVEARAQSVELVRALPVDPVWVKGDFDLLHRAILNLILNAVRHAPSASRVEVTLEAGAGSAVASIVDHGPGVPADALPKLFQRFSGRAGEGGTGLGLYFVRTVAEKHGGTVTVESVPNKITRFVLSLPLALH